MSEVVLPRDVARHLTAFAINSLLQDDEGCCPVCCGPCFGLKKLMDEGRLDEVVKPPTPGDAYDWQDRETGKVHVEQLTEAWDRGARLNNCVGDHEETERG